MKKNFMGLLIRMFELFFAASVGAFSNVIFEQYLGLPEAQKIEGAYLYVFGVPIFCALSALLLWVLDMLKEKSTETSEHLQIKKEKKTLVPKLSLSDADKKDILLRRYEETFNELRWGQSNVWKSMTIATAAIPTLLGSTALLGIENKIPFAAVAFIFVAAGLSILIRERKAFVEYIVIISRIESLLGLHERYDQFRDERLLPAHYEEGANSTYEDYVRKNMWKKTSLFFIFSYYMFCWQLSLFAGWGMICYILVPLSVRQRESDDSPN